MKILLQITSIVCHKLKLQQDNLIFNIIGFWHPYIMISVVEIDRTQNNYLRNIFKLDPKNLNLINETVWFNFINAKYSAKFSSSGFSLLETVFACNQKAIKYLNGENFATTVCKVAMPTSLQNNTIELTKKNNKLYCFGYVLLLKK